MKKHLREILKSMELDHVIYPNETHSHYVFYAYPHEFVFVSRVCRFLSACDKTHYYTIEFDGKDWLFCRYTR